MRAFVLSVLLVVALGCGKSSDNSAPNDDPKSGAKGKGSEPEGPPIPYEGEYGGDNPVAADAKYKGKRVTCSHVEIDRISRTKDGRAYVAPLSVLVQAPSAPAGTFGTGGFAPGRVPEPCYFYFLRTDAAAKGLKTGEVYEITGTCRGYQKDTFWRGNAPGMDWHVDFDDCVVGPAKKSGKS